MLLLPHLEEVLLGPVGFGLLLWFIAVLCLGAARREKSLAVLLALSAILASVVATGAYELSARHYSPNRDMPLIASGLFITFSLAAFVCGSLALAIGAAPVLDRLRKRRG